MLTFAREDCLLCDAVHGLIWIQGACKDRVVHCLACQRKAFQHTLKDDVKDAPQTLEKPLYCLNIFHPQETLLLCLHFLQQSKLSIVV